MRKGLDSLRENAFYPTRKIKTPYPQIELTITNLIYANAPYYFFVLEYKIQPKADQGPSAGMGASTEMGRWLTGCSKQMLRA